LPLFPVDQEIELDGEVPDRVAALARSGPHLAGASYLVDYPRSRPNGP
jgi:hypothetical protein